MTSMIRRVLGVGIAATVGVILAGCNDGSGGGLLISSASGTAAAATATASSSGRQSIDRAPTISGAPAPSVSADSSYSFTPVVAPASGTSLMFSITNKPVWATFDTSTGTLSGKPTAGNVGTYAQIGISVSDGTLAAALPPFSIAVTAAPTTPVALAIEGSPLAAVSVGAPYGFTPTTTDASGSTLTFSIANKPSWATFDTSTGTLSGTPLAANVGVAGGISISVSDGKTTATLPAFSIAVKSAVADSITLSWTPPSRNTNGQPATDLAGYHIHYGTSAKNLSTVVTVANAASTSQVIGNLTPGIWYFAVTSYNTAKVESTLSAVLPVTL